MNIPAPHSRWYDTLWERIKVTIVALLVPEWVLGWAIRQYLKAGQITKKLQEASAECREKAKAANEELGKKDPKESELR